MIDGQRRAVEGQSAIEQVAQRLRGRVGIRSDPGQVARDRAVEGDRIQAVATADIASHVACEVGRDTRQVDRREARRAGTGPTTTADYVVIAKHDAVAVQQANAKRAGILHPVVRDPHGLSEEPLPENGFSGLGHEPVTAEPQGCGC